MAHSHSAFNLLLCTVPAIIASSGLYCKVQIKSPLFLCTVTISWSSKVDPALPYLHLHHFSPPSLASLQSFSTFPTSAVGGLAQDSTSTRFHNPLMCHIVKVQGYWIGCSRHNHFPHSLQRKGQRLTETQPHIVQTIRGVEIVWWVKQCLKCLCVVVSGILCPG